MLVRGALVTQMIYVIIGLNSGNNSYMYHNISSHPKFGTVAIDH